MATQTLYVRDKELWDRARSFAETRNLSLSELIAVAIERLITDNQVCHKCERIREILGK